MEGAVAVLPPDVVPLPLVEPVPDAVPLPDVDPDVPVPLELPPADGVLLFDESVVELELPGIEAGWLLPGDTVVAGGQSFD